MSLNFKLRREIFERNRLDFANLADISFRELYDFEEIGEATAKVIRKCFAAIETLQHRSLTPTEKEHLLDEPYSAALALEDEAKAKKARPAREEQKARMREAALSAARLHEM